MTAMKLLDDQISACLRRRRDLGRAQQRNTLTLQKLQRRRLDLLVALSEAPDQPAPADDVQAHPREEAIQA